MTSFIRTPLHISLCPFGVRIRQVRLYLNSPTYSSLLHADQCKHYNATVVISVGVIKCVCPYTIHILLGKKGLYPLLFLGISSFCSIFSFAFLIQTTHDVLQGIFVFLLIMHTYARGFTCIRTNTCSEMRKQNIHAS